MGRRAGNHREILDVVFYDDLAPESLVDGRIVFPSGGYGPLWRRCRERRMEVVADVHTHPGIARQSPTDREHPMISERGHVALIVPDFAMRHFYAAELGVYEYLGAHQWNDRSGSNFFIRTWI